KAGLGAVFVMALRTAHAAASPRRRAFATKRATTLAQLEEPGQPRAAERPARGMRWVRRGESRPRGADLLPRQRNLLPGLQQSALGRLERRLPAISRSATGRWSGRSNEAGTWLTRTRVLSC